MIREEAYVRNKDKTELAGVVKIDVPFKQYIHVYVWENLAAMYRNTDFDEDNYEACYAALAFTRRKFGEIHLVKDGFGAGLFAHELQHFILHWIHEYGIDTENLCLLVGNVTSKFWMWHQEARWTQ